MTINYILGFGYILMGIAVMLNMLPITNINIVIGIIFVALGQLWYIKENKK